MDSLGQLESVFARNCTVRRIPSDVAAAFLERCHRLGTASCRYRYGLFVNRSTGGRESALPEGTLVAVATFSSPRTMKDGSRSYEWVRYASLPDVRVVGGMGKLMEGFVSEVHPDDIMSYADASVSDGGVYRELGFEEEGLVCGEGFTNRKFRLKFR
ncbi:MAG: hypothetical protein IJU27_08000 [Bacteroidales bacterium]|nr:hypothetical protein [Bacteroidales bacterium]